MTKILIHELPERTEALMLRLRTVVKKAGDSAEAENLLQRAVIESRDKPRMVLTGQYSSGKSTLVKALTDGAVEPRIDADIATDEVTEYSWDGSVVLVDTPGVQSGIRQHDDLALEAIGNADFILFVIHVGLFDDASSEYLRYLANTLQMFEQLIVVITQTSKQSAEEGAREEAVRNALGFDTYNLPIAEVDSLYYLRSLDGGERAERLRSESGIDDLRSKINKISNDRGEIAELRQPLHLIRQLCDEAQLLFVADERSRAALSVLAQQQAAVSQRKYMIEREFTRAESLFKSTCLVDVRGFVDTVTTLPSDESEAKNILDAAQKQLKDALNRHAEKFAFDINNLASDQFDTLAEQLLEISESNRAQLITRDSKDVKLETPSDLYYHLPANGDVDTGKVLDWNKVASILKKGQDLWGAGQGLKASSGTLGHEITKKIGHFFGKKFQPWEAIKIADKIGKVAKWGGAFIQVAAAGYEVWDKERKTQKELIDNERKHSAFVTEIMGHADKIASDARTRLWESIDPSLEGYITEIQVAQATILAADRARNESSEELQRIALDVDMLLNN